MSPVEIDQTLETAVRHHEAGQLAHAEALYKQILAHHPNHDEANHLLGVLALQVNRPDFALDYLRRATVLDPNISAYHGNLGNAFRGLGRLDEAVACYRRALELSPDLAEAHNNLGAVLSSQGKWDEAILCYSRALGLKPDYAEAHNNLGNALKERGKLNDAVNCFRRSLELKPDCAEALNHLGIAFISQGKLDEALSCFRRSLELKPDYAEALNNMGIAWTDLERYDEAIACYRRSLELKPSQAETHNNLGNALKEQGKLDEALLHCQRALELNPGFAEAHNNLGNVWRDQGRLEEAVACYRLALERRSGFAKAHNNLGIAFRDQGNLGGAEACFDEAIRLAPLFEEAHFNRAMLRVLRGDFARGWPEFEWRWKTKTVLARPRSFAKPLWDGGPLDGRTILLHCEQGFGDTFQFIRYAPMVAELGGNVIIECPPQVKRLLQSSLAPLQVVDYGDPLPPFDVQCPLLSLPMAFRTTLETIPRNAPYVQADPALVAQRRRKLSEFFAPSPSGTPGGEGGCEGGGHPSRNIEVPPRSTPSTPTPLKVGLAWAGNKSQKYDRTRSTTLKALAPLGRVPGVVFFSLQKGEPSLQALEPPAGMQLIDWTSGFVDFADTAALMANLDLVITVDTAISHLAGALGRPVWTMLWFGGDWRYLLEPEDVLWYPTMRLFRQPASGDWANVAERVAEALANRAA